MTPVGTMRPYPFDTRRQVIEDPSLSQELLRAFHTTDDPISLTEILRLLCSAAKTAPAAVALESEPDSQSSVVPVPAEAAVGLAPTMAAAETLERLGFFLESCLEEKLLSRVSSRRVTFRVRTRYGLKGEKDE